MNKNTEKSSKPLPRFWPASRMGRFTIVVSAIWLIKEVVIRRLIPPSTLALNLLYDLTYLLLLVPLFYYAYRLARILKRQFLWKIRRRLILSHIFVAVIPTLVILSIFLLTALLVYYQFGYYLMLNQVGLHTGNIEAYTLALRSGLEGLLDRALMDPSEIRQFLSQQSHFLQASYPEAGIRLRIDDSNVGDLAVYHAGFAERMPVKDYKVPKWLNENDFSGLVYEPIDVSAWIRDGYLKKRTQWSNLSLRAVAFSNTHPQHHFSIEVFVPLDRFFLKKLKAALGVDLLIVRQDPEVTSTLNSSPIRAENVIAATDEEWAATLQKPQAQPLAMHLYPVIWETGQEAPSHRTDLMYMQLSLIRLYQNLFLSESKFSQDIAEMLKFMLIFLVGVELVSVFIGLVLTKSITNAVNSLDRGTQIIKRGDFSHRIVVRSDDQLGSLAESFNRMVESLQGLLLERVEKERLQRELEIAKEVQAQLFPKSSPAITGLDITGICLPARTVSGDYFDYLLFTPEIFGIVVGDICGKGISAALLMANLQATLRSHLSRFEWDQTQAALQLRSESNIALMMEQLNRQIFSLTSPNKFATIFSVFFDRQEGRMTYCNAGHNPPILLKSGRPERLRTGGTVVGIFAEASYKQESVVLKPGDLLVAYTDGIVEAVNEYGEEFGEQRLQDLLLQYQHLSVMEIQRQMIDCIVDWSYGQERDDDMTLVVARVKEDWLPEPTERYVH